MAAAIVTAHFSYQGEYDVNNFHHNGCKARALLLCSGLLLAVPPAMALGVRPANDSALTARDREVLVDVLANDTGLVPAQLLMVRTRPAHGTAQVIDGKIRYVPAAGFTGRDRFTYLAKKGRNAGTATVLVDVGEALVLRGKVTDEPIADATVQASVDGHTFVTQADADGNYSLEVIGVDGGMVTMGAQGTGAQSAANFLSVVGDFDRLQQEAGSDGELTREENNQVQVTNLSTAQAHLLQVANDGAPITDDAQLVAARESLDNGQLLRQAAAIKLVVDGGYPLPEGIVDTLSLISDPAALSGFIATVNADDPSAFDDAIAQTASDPELTVPTSASELVGSYTLIFDLGAPGAISAGYIQGDRVTLEADGTGSYVEATPNPDPSVTWTYDDGRAVIIPNAPIQSTSYEVIDGIGQVRRLHTSTRYEISRLFDGNGRDTLAVSNTYSYSYPDNPGIPGGTRTDTATNTGIRDDAGILPFSASELADTTRALWVAGTPYANANFTGTDLFTFQSGGTGQRGDGPAFDWSVDPLGRLLVAFADGDQAAYARIKRDQRKGEGITAEWRADDGARSAAASLSMVAEGFQFTAANAQRSWRSGFYVSRSAPDDNDFFVVLDAAQIGWEVSYAGTNTFPTPVGWTVDGGVMDATAYRDGSNQPVHYCDVGIDGCYIWLVRRWRPVAADGDRAYVIEEFLYDNDGDGDIDLTNQRANYYDIAAAPPFVTAPPATRSKKKTRR